MHTSLEHPRSLKKDRLCLFFCPNRTQQHNLKSKYEKRKDILPAFLLVSFPFHPSKCWVSFQFSEVTRALMLHLCSRIHIRSIRKDILDYERANKIDWANTEWIMRKTEKDQTDACATWIYDLLLSHDQLFHGDVTNWSRWTKINTKRSLALVVISVNGREFRERFGVCQIGLRGLDDGWSDIKYNARPLFNAALPCTCYSLPF